MDLSYWKSDKFENVIESIDYLQKGYNTFNVKNSTMIFIYLSVCALAASQDGLTYNRIYTYESIPYDTNFDVKYNGNFTTSGGMGWCIVTSVDDVEWKPIISRNNVIYYNHRIKLNWTTEFSRPYGPNYLLVTFKCDNEGDEQRTFNLTCYADIDLMENRLTPVYWYGGKSRRGITTIDPNTGINLTIISRDKEFVDDVDTMWFGQFTNYSYDSYALKNRTSQDPLNNTDFVVSLGWKNRVIMPKQTKTFSFLIGVDEDLKEPPDLYISTNFSKYYNAGDKVNIIGKLTNYNSNENIIIHIEFNGEMVSHHLNDNELRIDFNYSIETHGKTGDFPLVIYAFDENNRLKSNVINATIRVNLAPNITVDDGSVNPEYFSGEIINIEGRVWDENNVTIYYQIDNFESKNASRLECNNESQEYSFSIYPGKLSYGNHTLYIWAEDDFGLASEKIEFDFKTFFKCTPCIQMESGMAFMKRIRKSTLS